MAAETLSKPGTKYGPCGPYNESCQHKDCQMTRDMAAFTCPWCDEPIGYERRFYKVDGPVPAGNYAHASCEEDAIEEGRV